MFPSHSVYPVAISPGDQLTVADRSKEPYLRVSTTCARRVHITNVKMEMNAELSHLFCDKRENSDDIEGWSM